MENDPPLLAICWGKINDVSYNYVKGIYPQSYFRFYDVTRFDTLWLDK